MSIPSPAVFACLSLSLVACASPGRGPDLVEPEARTPEVLVFDGREVTRLERAALLERVRDADVVLIGELHGHPVGLPFAAELFERAIRHEPSSALALEFLARDTQHLVDAYLADLIDWDSMVAGMAGSAASSPEPHRPMIESAKAAGVPVLAANSPRIYTRAASKLGYGTLSALSSSQRRLFDVPPVMPGGAYEQGFYDLMGGHMGGHGAPEDGPSDALRGSFRAQALWDGTMAATVSRVLGQGHAPVFLVVGQYHCDHDGGTLQVLRNLNPEAKILVVSVSASWSDVLLEEDRGRADCIAYVGPFEP
ncbi:MAG: ChaN family lipoprotein [Planctomycetota bacterium]|nr:ChaN family lipoprotein [Planctomycetota bacterium]